MKHLTSKTLVDYSYPTAEKKAVRFEILQPQGAKPSIIDGFFFAQHGLAPTEGRARESKDSLVTCGQHFNLVRSSTPFEIGMVDFQINHKEQIMSQSVCGSAPVPSNLVTIQNGKPATTSNVIAVTFGKNHKSVLRAVRNLECSPDFRERNFAPIQIDVDLGMGRTRQDPAYIVSRDGFMFLAMGFTGKEAAKWKEQFINAFNAMESELKSRKPYTALPGDALTLEQADILRNLLTNAAKKLPIEKQGDAIKKGWSKLKSHFGVSYREIPQSEFTEAISIIARHAAQWELLDAPEMPNINVNDLLLKASGTCDPTVELPVDLQKAIELRAWELAGEAYHLVKEHLHRRVAWECEYGHPRKIDVDKAYKCIQEGGIGYALSIAHYTGLRECLHWLGMAQKSAEETAQQIRTHLNEYLNHNKHL